MKKAISVVTGLSLLCFCIDGSEKPDDQRLENGAGSNEAEEIVMKAGTVYILRPEGSAGPALEISLERDRFSLCELSQSGHPPFSVSCEDGAYAFLRNKSEGGKVVTTFDDNGDGLADRRLSAEYLEDGTPISGHIDKVFFEFRRIGSSREITEEAEQGVAPQSATRSESNSEGGDKPQPESEPRPR